ncbi:Phospholipid/glycerol acyltransferase [Desulfonema limicola]|uniref:Phospholipid/glycerol acyltransferase n=2 Tax=Desulfonema limicola TaxID=45656 RepID=A0A975B7K5_9BACT|nr:Phospholipid/glycerol acyltransferase [Desulfonema limicola]
MEKADKLFFRETVKKDIMTLKHIADIIVTLAVWTYYIAGFLIFFSPLYFISYIFSKNLEKSWQKLNHLFLKSFFGLVKFITPGLSYKIENKVLALRSSIIVSNHISYLDPIFLVSLYEKQKTVVKSVFFKVPVFGWILKTSGYIPSTTGGDFDLLMIRHFEAMESYLESGGNLFIFPEGTRSRSGNIGQFSKGAFKIARKCKAPIQVLFIKNTDRLYRPDKFWFNTCVPNTISVELIASIEPDYDSKDFSISNLMEHVRSLMQQRYENER